MFRSFKKDYDKKIIKLKEELLNLNIIEDKKKN